MNIFAEHYGDLYTLDNSSLCEFEDFFPICDSLIISLEHHESMDALIRLQEVISVIETLGLGKALGPDGFTSEFYKMFKLILAPRLHEVFTLAFEAKRLQSTICAVL